MPSSNHSSVERYYTERRLYRCVPHGQWGDVESIRWSQWQSEPTETSRGWGTRYTLASHTLGWSTQGPFKPTDLCWLLGMGILTDFHLKKKRQLHSKKNKLPRVQQQQPKQPRQDHGRIPSDDKSILLSSVCSMKPTNWHPFRGRYEKQAPRFVSTLASGWTPRWLPLLNPLEFFCFFVFFF